MNIDYLYANRLFDSYGLLLTARQRKILEDYYHNDFSMQEIATNEGVSKAAISDLLNRASKQLLYYESILHLIDKEDKRKLIYAKMRHSMNKESQYFIKLLEDIDTD